jgi:hypothetical protein
MIWQTDAGDGMNRHFDQNNRPLDRPIYDPPSILPEGIRRCIDVADLVKEIVVSPLAPTTRLVEAQELLATTGITARIRESSLTRYSSFIPTEDELRRFMT